MNLFFYFKKLAANAVVRMGAAAHAEVPKCSSSGLYTEPWSWDSFSCRI